MTNKKFSIPAVTADQMMSRPVMFLRSSDTMQHAAAIFLDNKISGAPVLNHLDEPMGVVTKTDIIRFEREYAGPKLIEQGQHLSAAKNALELISKGWFSKESPQDFVAYWMTPDIYSVNPETLLINVIEKMAWLEIHRLFVRERNNGEITGVITTFDLLRHLAKFAGSESEKKKRAVPAHP